MKSWIIAVAIVLAVWNPVAYADDASKKAAAEELLKVTKVDQMTKPIFEQMRLIMEKQFTQMGATEEMKPILKKYTDRLFDAMEKMLGWQTLKEEEIALYIKVFTEEELKGMLAFYKSPVGQTVIDKMPTTMQQSMQIVQKLLPELREKVKKISDDLATEVKAEKEKKK
jgi:hypothetical protein